MELKFKEDMNRFFEIYENNHPAPYYMCSKEEIMKFLDDYEGKHKIDDYFAFEYIMRVMIKKLNGKLDSHTTITFKDSNLLPIQFKCFADGLYVVNTNSTYKNLLGNQVISINNIPISQIIKEIELACSYITENWRRRCIAWMISGSHGILMLPSIDSNSKKIVFEFINKVGSKEIIEFDVNKIYEIDLTVPNYWYHIIDKAIIFKYSSCVEEYENQMKQTVVEMNNVIKKEHLEKFILDLRNNLGGWSEYINPLIEYLQKTELTKIVLTNGSTYSSAIMAMQKMMTLDDTIFIGDYIGSTFNCFGNVDCQEILPNTGVKAKVSTKYFGDNFSVNSQEQFKKIDRSKIIDLNYNPDILIPEIKEDILNGNDSIMKAALNYNENKNLIR